MPITGRQITWMLYDYFKVSTNDGVLLDWEEILQVTLKGDNLSQFLTDWETTLLNIQDPPTDSMLEGLLRNQLEKSEQLKNSMSLYWQDITQRGEEKSYEKLLTTLRTHIDRKRLDRNKASLGKGPNAAAAAGPKPATKGTCHQWDEKGKCSRGDKCPWVNSHTKERANSVRPTSKGPGKGNREESRGRDKGKGRGKGGRGRSESRPKSAAKPTRGSSPSGKKDRKACRDYVLGSCTRGSECDYWHPPVCRDWRAGTCTDDKKCAFLHQEKPAKTRSAAPAQAEAKPKPKAKAKAGANVAILKEGLLATLSLSNLFNPLSSATALPMIPKARSCDFSCCPAGGDTHEIIPKKVAFSNGQTRISKKQENCPTYVKWGLKNKSFVLTNRPMPEGTWFRGDRTLKDLPDLEAIEWHEEQARHEAYRLYKQSHSIHGPLTDEFFVRNAGGDPQPTWLRLPKVLQIALT